MMSCSVMRWPQYLPCASTAVMASVQSCATGHHQAIDIIELGRTLSLLLVRGAHGHHACRALCTLLEVAAARSSQPVGAALHSAGDASAGICLAVGGGGGTVCHAGSGAQLPCDATATAASTVLLAALLASERVLQLGRLPGAADRDPDVAQAVLKAIALILAAELLWMGYSLPRPAQLMHWTNECRVGARAQLTDRT
jgi:hypothetical protein